MRPAFGLFFRLLLREVPPWPCVCTLGHDDLCGDPCYKAGVPSVKWAVFATFCPWGSPIPGGENSRALCTGGVPIEEPSKAASHLPGKVVTNFLVHGRPPPELGYHREGCEARRSEGNRAGQHNEATKQSSRRSRGAGGTAWCPMLWGWRPARKPALGRLEFSCCVTLLISSAGKIKQRCS